MKETSYAYATVTILGVEFQDVDEIIQYAQAHKPKDGVWVGADSESYPCFDSSDYAYEDRSYWNFVFARSKQEMVDKLDRLRGMSPLAGNYRKLTDSLRPMAYWGGDRHHLLELCL